MTSLPRCCIYCNGPLTLGSSGVCLSCLHRQGDIYTQTGDIRAFFHRPEPESDI